jgi:hypothetical protein
MTGADGRTIAVHPHTLKSPMAALGATLDLVSAYAPVPEPRLRVERRDAPEDVQWAINPRQEVEESLTDAADIAREAHRLFREIGASGHAERLAAEPATPAS